MVPLKLYPKISLFLSSWDIFHQPFSEDIHFSSIPLKSIVLDVLYPLNPHIRTGMNALRVVL